MAVPRFPPGCSVRAARMGARSATSSPAAGGSLRVALQSSGHFRDLCSSNATFKPLQSLVQRCRSIAAVCDLFLHTWDTLSPWTSTWHTWWPDPMSSMSSAKCVQMVQARLGPVAVAVDRQTSAPNGWGNLTWRYAVDRNNPKGADRDTHVSLYGIRSVIRGAARAAGLRQAHERTSGVPYDVSIRIRPDLYQREIAKDRAEPIRLKLNQVCAVPAAAWPLIASAQRCATCVKGCDDQMVPGRSRSTDMVTRSLRTNNPAAPADPELAARCVSASGAARLLHSTR